MTFVTKSCPQCHASLVEVNRSGVMIDVCPECKGIWLDRGELERIIQMTRELEAEFSGYGARPPAEQQRARPPEPRDSRRWDGDDDDDDDHRRRHWDDDDRKRRKGPLGKLLDIFD